jgi:hypothetical protein
MHSLQASRAFVRLFFAADCASSGQGQGVLLPPLRYPHLLYCMQAVVD